MTRLHPTATPRDPDPADLRARVDAWLDAEAESGPEAAGGDREPAASRRAGEALARVFEALPTPHPPADFARRVLRAVGLTPPRYRDLQGIWRWVALVAVAATVLGAAIAVPVLGWRPLDPSGFFEACAHAFDLSGRLLSLLGGALTDALVLAATLGSVSPYLGAALLVVSIVVLSLARLAGEWLSVRRRLAHVR